MKRSRHVVLLITGSVMLSACGRPAPPPRPSLATTPINGNAADDPDATPTPTPSPTTHYTHHTGSYHWYWFGRDNPGASQFARPTLGSSSSSHAESASGVSRGGFGAHGSGGE